MGGAVLATTLRLPRGLDLADPVGFLQGALAIPAVTGAQLWAVALARADHPGRGRHGLDQLRPRLCGERGGVGGGGDGAAAGDAVTTCKYLELISEEVDGTMVDAREVLGGHGWP